ncbi:beta family protein [Dehalococcoides mccartyi]|uniref:beta family protein n=1 Tax=Dehalococcoides mccartyi TaxID=61435 RepID=UPI0003C8A0B8|nr:beta family protein [Dehalococcoides mccartyi]AHB12885.1 hypothetical protein GY50_0099 [Dehalococcoides mccartyi GY50]
MTFCYVPILKSKDGELVALRQLDTNSISEVAPLIELQERSRDSLLNRTLNSIKNSWPIEQSFYLDIDKDYLLSNGNSTNVYRSAINYLLENNLKVIPVTGLSRSTDFNLMIRDILSCSNNGICIRMQDSDWQNISTISSTIEELSRSFSLENHDIDLILDYGSFLPDQAGIISTSAIATINSISNINEYRNLIFVSTSFPARFDAEPYDIVRQRRFEYEVWQGLRDNHDIQRVPIFGDYATVHPFLPNIDFRFTKIAPKIKYATDSEWIYLRGIPRVNETFRDICSKIINLDEYAGPDYSWGDRIIHECATNNGSVGNPRSWVSIGLNHHLTLVSRQCANPGAV